MLQLLGVTQAFWQWQRTGYCEWFRMPSERVSTSLFVRSQTTWRLWPLTTTNKWSTPRRRQVSSSVDDMTSRSSRQQRDSWSDSTWLIPVDCKRALSFVFVEISASDHTLIASAIKRRYLYWNSQLCDFALRRLNVMRSHWSASSCV